MRILTVVVFPAPLGPSRPKVSPSCTSRSTPLRAVTSPYFLTRPRVRMETDSKRGTPGWLRAGGIYQTPCEGSMLAGLSADGDVLAGIAGQSCGAGPGSFARARLRALHARSPWFRARPER